MVGGAVNHVRTVGKLERRWHTTGQSADGTTSVDFRLSLLIARVPPGGAISYIISVWAYEVKFMFKSDHKILSYGRFKILVQACPG